MYDKLSIAKLFEKRLDNRNLNRKAAGINLKAVISVQSDP